MNLFLAGNPSFPKYFKCFMWTEERAIQKPTNVDRVLDTNKVIIILTAYKTPSSCKSLSLPDVNKKYRLIKYIPLSILLQNYHLKYDQTPPCKHLYKVFSSYSLMQMYATLSANSSQHCWMLNVASIGTPCCMLLQCCCMLLGVVTQTFSHVQMDTTILSLAHI